MSKGVAITGMGIISSIGFNVEENLTALFKGKKGIAPIVNIKTRHKDDIKVGEVLKTNSQLAEIAKISETLYSRTTLLGLIAAKEAFNQAELTDTDALTTGFISATSVGGMDITEKHFNQFGKSSETNQYLRSHESDDSTQKITKHLGLKGYTTTISTACSSSANSIMLGARLIKSGKLDRVIVGGTDCLSKFTINGFKSLMILSDSECRPFDDNRKGLNLGEAAAYLVLESEKVIKQKDKEVLGYVSGYSNANDAFHQTASSADGEGAFLAMQKALKSANLQADDIDYINAHGTATLNNDLSEGTAIKRIFKNDIPDFSSTKAFTGHTLAAAGAIEAVYSLLALQNNVVFPNLNFKTPIRILGIQPVETLKEKSIQNVLSNSFGFGGNCSTLIFSKSR